MAGDRDCCTGVCSCFGRGRVSRMAGVDGLKSSTTATDDDVCRRPPLRRLCSLLLLLLQWVLELLLLLLLRRRLQYLQRVLELLLLLLLLLRYLQWVLELPLPPLKPHTGPKRPRQVRWTMTALEEEARSHRRGCWWNGR